MPSYVFRCSDCGGHDASYPMSEVPDSARCPSCGQDARRVVTAVGLGRGGSSAMRLLDTTAATASEPPVVSGPPAVRRESSRRVSTDPRHARLPRP